MHVINIFIVFNVLIKASIRHVYLSSVNKYTSHARNLFILLA